MTTSSEMKRGSARMLKKSWQRIIHGYSERLTNHNKETELRDTGKKCHPTRQPELNVLGSQGHVPPLLSSVPSGSILTELGDKHSMDISL